MILKSSCFLIFVGVGMHCLGYYIWLVGKMGRNTIVMAVQVNYLTYF
jgi:hypothetical protein